MATFGYWSLLIGPADNETDDSRRPPCVSDLVSDKITRGSLLCELQREDDGFVCISARLLKKGSLDDFLTLRAERLYNLF